MRNEISAAHLVECLVTSILDSASMTVIDGSFHEQLVNIVDNQSTDVCSVEDVLRSAHAAGLSNLLDFGCGTAGHRGMLESFGFKWTGVNYSSGMAQEAREAAKHDQNIDFYDGLSLPYGDQKYDIVYSYQTFEHIQDIKKTFSEIRRVLKPGGRLIGQVSYMEQIHDYSTFNFTPYGFKIACEQAGLRLDKIYPKFDAITWLVRRLIICTSGSDDNSLSPLMSGVNPIGEAFINYGRKQGLSPAQTNLFRLMFSSHFVFDVSRQ